VNKNSSDIRDPYVLYRDYEIAQPLYDLAFVLEIAAILAGTKTPKYRKLALWKAALAIDSYGSFVEKSLLASLANGETEFEPSDRIKLHLHSIIKNGAIAELEPFLLDQKYQAALRLRALRGVGPSQIAKMVASEGDRQACLSKVAKSAAIDAHELAATYDGKRYGIWQAAHVVPPLLRILSSIETLTRANPKWIPEAPLRWNEPIEQAPVISVVGCDWKSIKRTIDKAVALDPMFTACGIRGQVVIRHVMGWAFAIRPRADAEGSGAKELSQQLDPLVSHSITRVKGDLHSHTSWSDGLSPPAALAAAASANGIQYLAITDHSRSSKLQRGVTPPEWLHQASSLLTMELPIPVLHGIEVDILADGSLDLPASLLRSAHWVVGSVHGHWSPLAEQNTQRLIRAITSGCVDTIGHPSSRIVGKPGVPNYVREPAKMDWDAIFEMCVKWRVALEFNCFPSRFDLQIELLRKAQSKGCWISLGSDAHATAHLIHIKFGEAVLESIDSQKVLNCLDFHSLTQWIVEARAVRQSLGKSRMRVSNQRNFDFCLANPAPKVTAQIAPRVRIPNGSSVVGIDLTGGNKLTGIAYLRESSVTTSSLLTDDEILSFVCSVQPKIVSIDSPLGLPGGGDTIDSAAGIVRRAEHDLNSIGISAYPALIDSMQQLTLRGIRLARRLRSLPDAPTVIESYPGAAQDILSLPRKQYSLQLLKDGLRAMGLTGSGLDSNSHDEIDAITAAVVGRFFECGKYEPMGIESEAQLIVPKHCMLNFETPPIICLSGKTGAGKSVVARYLAVVYGFRWIKTRDLIRDLLAGDSILPATERLFKRSLNADGISESDLREFGLVILKEHKQIPLRRKLFEVIRSSLDPVVVDSIRDTSDVEADAFAGRRVYHWFIDAADRQIQSRLEERARRNHDKLTSRSPIDDSASKVKGIADLIIRNDGSLEELRWKIDDAICDCIELRSNGLL
jgi:histidinol phosphatase-like PHP family hydrolase/predicted nuclease with RNAse H fold/dephospho-CoA kinase